MAAVSEVAESPENCVEVDFRAISEAIRSKKFQLRAFQKRVACVQKHLQEMKSQLSSAFDARARLSSAERAAKAGTIASATLDQLLALQSVIDEARELAKSGSSDQVIPLILELEKVADDFTEVAQDALARKARISTILG